MYSRALSRPLPPPTPPQLYQLGRCAARWRPAHRQTPPRRRRSIQPCSSGSTSVGRARATVCDCGAVTVRAAGRGWAENSPNSFARSSGMDRIGRWQSSRRCRRRRHGVPPGPPRYHEVQYLVTMRCPKTSRISRTFPGNFLEVFPKLLGSCSEVARKFPGGVEAVHAPSCDIPLPLAMFGGRRTACAAGLHVGMGHCTGAAQTGASQVGRPGCKLDGFRKWEKSEVSPLVHTASVGLGPTSGTYVERRGRWFGYRIRAGE
jgi:hypothetical protein